MNWVFRAVLAIAMFVAVPALAGEIQITEAWTRAMLPGPPIAGGFMSIANDGRGDVRLTSASSPRAAEVQIHEMAINDGVMTMRPLPNGIAIGADETVRLEPGGLHLMFMGVTDRFTEGESVPVTLEFADGSRIEIELTVLEAGAKKFSR